MTPTLQPTLKQHQAFQLLQNDRTTFVGFGGGAGGGKSWFGCEWLLTNCYFYPQTRWFIGREELKRLMQSTFITWTKVTSHHKIPRSDWHLDGKYNYIEFSNGSRIDLLDCKYLPSDPLYERFGSLEYTGGWLEEAGEIKFMAFDVLKSRINRHLNRELGLPPKLLLTFNPNKDWLYRVLYRPWKDGTLEDPYAFIQALYKDNPHTAETYGKTLAGITDKATRERLMFGNWEYDDDPSALIEYDAIIDLFTNAVPESPDKYLTADIARYGHDKTVFYCWKGLKVYKIYIYEKQGIDQTNEKLEEILKTEQIPRSHTVVDEDGVGGGVVDGVKGIKGFTAGSSPIERPTKDENYQNLKTQCSYLLAEKVNKRELAIETNDEVFKEQLVEELEQIKSKDRDKDGVLKIVPKEEIKEHIGRSPDYADPLMMRMYFELKKPVRAQVTTGVQGGVRPLIPGIG